MGKFMDIGQIPSMLSFVCAAMTVIVPLMVSWIINTAKKNGNPPWKEEEKPE